MNPIYIIYIIVLSLIKIKLSKAITVTAIAFIYSEKIDLYKPFADEFNKYSKEKKLDIVFDLTILTPDNSTSYINDYGIMIDNLLQKKTKKYDIFFYYGTYTKRYGKYFINLEDWLPKEHIDMYDPQIISKSCLYNNKVVGLPITIDISVLYSNQMLLSKYEKEIPKTWDELIETSKYIFDVEKNNFNNTNLITFNGLFNKGDQGIVSIYEFINSFRDSNNSPYPETQSETSEEALKMMKKLKNEISSDLQFQLDDYDTITRLFTGTAIFLRFWYLPHSPIYKASAVPGKNKNVSGSMAGAYNIAINRYSDSEKKKAAIEVLKFITSKEIQKKLIISKNYYSSISSLYDEEDVCQMIDCKVIKDMMPFSAMDFDTKQFDLDFYIDKYKSYVYDYLYGNKTVSEVLKNIDDITKIYTFDIKTNNSLLGLVILIIFILSSIIIVSSVVFLFSEKYNLYYKNLPIIFWVFSPLGSFIILCSVLTFYGNMTVVKLTLNSITFIMLMISPIKIKNIIIIEGENSQKCDNYKSFGLVLFHIIEFYISFLIFSILLLIFIEWNYKESYYNVRFLLAAIIMDILSVIIYIIFNKIDINDYNIYGFILSIIIFILALSNYTFTYGIRVLLVLIQKKKDDFDEEEFIKKNKIYNERLSNTTTTKATNSFNKEIEFNSDSDSSSKNRRKSSVVSSNERRTSIFTENIRKASVISNKIMNYHFTVSKE
ncbi:periplasmic binding protein-like II, partial [Neocallimastix sp. 'constans']